MLATESMLNALEEVEVEEVYTNNNDDHDFGKVLEFCCDLEQPERAIRCSDGQLRMFSF